MGITILIGLVIFLVVIGFFLYFITIYNSLVRLKNDMDKAWSNIDVLLKQRHDELPNLVEAVKDLMAYEQETLTRVTDLRAAYAPDAPVPAQATTSEATTAAPPAAKSMKSVRTTVRRLPPISTVKSALPSSAPSAPRTFTVQLPASPARKVR